MSATMPMPIPRTIAVLILVLAVGLGGWAAQELGHYLDVICVVRGECYGRTDWVYWISLVPPLTLTGVLSSVLVVVLAWSAGTRFVLQLVGRGGMPEPAVTRSITRVRHGLVGVGVLSMIGFGALAVWFMQV